MKALRICSLVLMIIGVFFASVVFAQDGSAPRAPEPTGTTIAEPVPAGAAPPAPPAATNPPEAASGPTTLTEVSSGIPPPIPKEASEDSIIPIAAAIFAAGLGTAVLWRLSQKKKAKEKNDDSQCLNWKKIMEKKLNELTDIKIKLGDFAKNKTLEELKRETRGTRAGELVIRAEQAEKEYRRLRELYEKCLASLLGEKEKSALRWIVGILNKHDVPFQISGGLAAKLYGSPRPLNDIDIDIPREKFEEIISDVREYITLGPQDYKDEKWDLYLMTLNYGGQEIDIGSADIKIYDEKGNRWVPFSSGFDKSVWKEIEDLKIPIIPKDDLIAVKKYLSGEHQKIDLGALS